MMKKIAVLLAFVGMVGLVHGELAELINNGDFEADARYDVIIEDEHYLNSKTLEHTTSIPRKEVDKFITDSLAKHLTKGATK